MREQCKSIFRQARRDVREAGMPELAGSGDAEKSPDTIINRPSPRRRRSCDSRRIRASSSDSERTAGIYL